MRGLFAALLAAAIAPAQHEPAPVFVEVVPPGGPVFEQQPVEVAVQIGWDAAFFASSGVPLFQQRFEVPFHVRIPWLFAADDRAVELLPTAAGASLPVNDRTASAERAGTRDVGGRTFELLVLRCRWLPLVAQDAVIAPVEVRYAFATEFTDSVLAGRQPVDRQEQQAMSAAGLLVVRPLPRPKPAGFHGAVGDFALAAALDADEVRVGDTVAVRLTVTGDGNLMRFAPPPPPELDGFHVMGIVERRSGEARTFVLDVLALRAGVTELPAIPFVAFAPAAGDYVTLYGGPLPLAVLPPRGELPPPVQALVDADAAKVRARQRWPWWTWLVLAVSLVAIARFVRLQQGVARRRRERDAVVARLRALPADADAVAVARAFEQALLALVGGSDAFAIEAVVAALRRRGNDDDTIAEVFAVHRALDGARFGGPMPERARVVEVVETVARR